MLRFGERRPHHGRNSSACGRAAPATARRWRREAARVDRRRCVLAAAALSSILITVAIVVVLFCESSSFFGEPEITLSGFLFGTSRCSGSPRGPAHRSGQALHLAAGLRHAGRPRRSPWPWRLPIGTIVAIYLSEFAPFALRETIKPSLELLSAVPTVVYGYFALTVRFAAPAMVLIPELPPANMLSAGHRDGDHDHSLRQLAQRRRDAERCRCCSAKARMRWAPTSCITAWRRRRSLGPLGHRRGLHPGHLAGHRRNDDRRHRRRHAAAASRSIPPSQAQTITAYIVATSQGDTAARHDRLSIDLCRRADAVSA